MEFATSNHYTTHDSPEYDLIKALQCRYIDVSTITGSENGVSQNTLEYANELRKVYSSHPDNPCIAALFAEALLNLDPWNLYDPETKLPRAFTAEALAVVQRGLTQSPLHPGLNHFLVHVLEMSPQAAIGLAQKDILCSAYPDVGHLIHMASHLSCVLGRWQEVVDINTLAKSADDKYLAVNGIRSYYAGYCCHDLMFIVYGAMMAGIVSSSAIQSHVSSTRCVVMYVSSTRCVVWVMEAVW
jgi:hypothetical protein